MMKFWFVLYCKPLKDAIAQVNLERQGYEVYRPTIKIEKPILTNGLKKIREDSLFPRYLFLNVDPEEQSLTPIKYTVGILDFIKFGDRYSTVSELVINKIKLCEQQHRIADTGNNDYRAGDEVYINGEGFSDIKATFCDRCSDNRVLVLLKMLGSTSTIKVPASYVTREAAY